MIRVAIAGIGNCASSLIQGIAYYGQNSSDEYSGIMAKVIGTWKVTDIQIVAAFDVDSRKVGSPLEEAIFADPNCSRKIVDHVPPTGITVKMGPVMDGVAAHMESYPEEQAFRVARARPVDIAAELERVKAEILVCYLPVGSEQAVSHYAEACLQANVSMINCVPVFIASNNVWAKRFHRAGIPIIGDDIKSQLGATILHRSIVKLFEDRGIDIQKTYQINTGGNTDFLNMLEQERLMSKKVSKTEAVQSVLFRRIDEKNIHIGPSDYVPWQQDGKVAFIRVEGEGFCGMPVEVEVRLSVHDSPNSAGVVIDAIRCAKLGLERGLAGPLIEPSSYYMKSPPQQFEDSIARDQVTSFIAGSDIGKQAN